MQSLQIPRPIEHTEAVMPSLSLAGINLNIETIAPSSSDVTLKQQQQGPHEQKQHGQHHDAWNDTQVKDRMHWLQGFKPTKKGGLVFLDQEIIKKQQGVVKEVMVQVGAQLLSGKLAVRISLPTRIFEPRTLLERVADGWNYAPTLLKKAAISSDPLERMKFFISFMTGGFHFCIGQLKPFNPILGETYQAAYPDGTQVFLEHVSHHPPMAAFTLVGPKNLYTLSGIYEFESVMSRNSIINHQIGTARIEFADRTAITYTVPQIRMSGLLLGERVVDLCGTAKFQDLKSNLQAEVNFDANNSFLIRSNGDDIKGQIFHVKGNTKQTVCHVQGTWLSHLQFDGKVYWHVESEPVFQHVPIENPLPSDSRFREDVIALKEGNLTLAQSEKLRLEELQRVDKKIRDQANKKT